MSLEYKGQQYKNDVSLVRNGYNVLFGASSCLLAMCLWDTKRIPFLAWYGVSHKYGFLSSVMFWSLVLLQSLHLFRHEWKTELTRWPISPENHKLELFSPRKKSLSHPHVGLELSLHHICLHKKSTTSQTSNIFLARITLAMFVPSKPTCQNTKLCCN